MKVDDYLKGISITYKLQNEENKKEMKELRRILEKGLTLKQCINQGDYILRMKKRIKEEQD